MPSEDIFLGKPPVYCPVDETGHLSWSGFCAVSQTFLNLATHKSTMTWPPSRIHDIPERLSRCPHAKDDIGQLLEVLAGVREIDDPLPWQALPRGGEDLTIFLRNRQG